MKYLIAIAALAALLATSAWPQSRNCASRDKMLEGLASKYGETRQSIGLDANNSVVEMFASTETGTWTITVTTPQGLTCMVASGRAFENVHEAVEPSGLKL